MTPIELDMSHLGLGAGRRYRDDPTIFGWDLINEPRCNCFPKKLPPIAEWDDMDGPCSPKCADKITVRLVRACCRAFVPKDSDQQSDNVLCQESCLHIQLEGTDLLCIPSTDIGCMQQWHFSIVLSQSARQVCGQQRHGEITASVMHELYCIWGVQAWTHEMAAYLKEKDPNHLVTVGLEGFWSSHAEEAAESNPLPGENGSLSWTALTGQNFTAQHDSPHIDFCGAHYWPDLWVSPGARPIHPITMRLYWSLGSQIFHWHSDA